MKKILSLLLIASITTLLFSCNDDDDTDYGNWVERSNFEGVRRSGAVSFTIDNIVYITTILKVRRTTKQ